MKPIKNLTLLLLAITVFNPCNEDDSNSPDTIVQIPDANFEQVLIDLDCENIHSPL